MSQLSGARRDAVGPAWSTGTVPLTPADVGGRVVVRHRLPDGRATDALGHLLRLDDAELAVRRGDGEEVVVAAPAVVAARAVPAPPPRRGPRAGAADALPGVEAAARRSALGWPPARAAALGDWALRSSPGSVLRGRSVLAVGDPGLPVGDAVSAVIEHGAAVGQEPVVAVASPLRGSAADDGGRAGALEAELVRRRWTCDGWTVLALRPLPAVGRAGGSAAAGGGPRVELAPSPSPAWFAASERRGAPLRPEDLPVDHGDVAVVWASATDGRGEGDRDPAGSAVHRAGDGAGVVAVARGALAVGWLGITCVHVVPSARRRGAARAVVEALTEWAGGQGCDTAYVQVLEANAPARELWRAAGFADHSRYRYWHPPG